MGAKIPKFFASVNENMTGISEKLEITHKVGLPNSSCKEMHKAIYLSPKIFVLLCKNITLWEFANNNLVVKKFVTVNNSKNMSGDRISDNLFYYLTDTEIVVYDVQKEDARWRLPIGRCYRCVLVTEENEIVVWSSEKTLQRWNLATGKLVAQQTHAHLPDQIVMKRWRMWNDDMFAVLHRGEQRIHFFHAKTMESVGSCAAQGIKDIYFVRKYILGFAHGKLVIADMNTVKPDVDLNKVAKHISIPEPPRAYSVPFHYCHPTEKKKRVVFVLPYLAGFLDVDSAEIDSLYMIENKQSEDAVSMIHRVSYVGERKLFIQQSTVFQNAENALKQWLLVDMKTQVPQVLITKDDQVLTGAVVKVENDTVVSC